jgi:hypothetical protein
LLLVSYPCPCAAKVPVVSPKVSNYLLGSFTALVAFSHAISSSSSPELSNCTPSSARRNRKTRHVRLPETAKREIFVMAASAQNSHNYGGNNKNEITLRRGAQTPACLPALLSFDTQCFWPAAVKQKIDIFTNCAPLARLNFFSPRSAVPCGGINITSQQIFSFIKTRDQQMRKKLALAGC